jgi:acyl dehydratase
MIDRVRFGDLTLGLELTPFSREISQEVIDLNAVASLDFNPVHTNLDWCARRSPFGLGKSVSHGMLTISMMASVITGWCYGSGATISRLEAKLTKPVLVGDPVTASGQVKELHPIGPGRNHAVISLEARNGVGELVATGSARVDFPD